MRILALDVGDRRVGLAISDPTALLATPLGAVERSESDIAEIVQTAKREWVSEIVVGLPLALSGEERAQAAKVRTFIRELRAETDIPIKPIDERLSTVQARRLLTDIGGSGQSPAKSRRDRRSGRIDAAAAAVILQSYLDARR